jgi:YD repeat-containing protein
MAREPAFSACRDCAQPGFGGPGENRFTAYDFLCRGDVCRESGAPEIAVNLASLTLYIHSTDMVFGGLLPALAIDRSYSQDDIQAGPFGPGWTFNLGENLTKTSDGTLVLRRGSGHIDRWAAGADSTTLFAVTSTADLLVQNADGTYTLSSPASNTTKTFSSDGRLVAIRDSGAVRVSLEYDGARLKTAHYRGQLLTFTYDGGGHLASISDTASRSATYTYTADGRLAQATNADGQSAAYQYDGSGLLVGIVYRGGTTAISYTGDPGYVSVAAVTTQDGAVRAYDLPRTPMEIRVTDGNGDQTLYAANALGQVTSIADAAGTTVSYTYDAAGRRIRTVNGAGESQSFTYDAAGNLTGITDGAGNRWSAAYSIAGLAQITDPRGSVWQFRYDAAGNLIGVTDPASGAVTATRSAAGQITGLTDARGNKLAYVYNSDGLLTGFTDALGGAWTYQYDGAARVSTRTEPGGAVLTASYTGGNRLAAVAAGDARLAFDYSGQQRDSLGRLANYTDSFGNQVSYTYDAAGQLSSMTLPGGKTVTYQYDHAHRLSKIADWTGNFAVYRYDAAGWPASVSVSGGPVTIYQYDTARRLRAIVSTGPDGLAVAGYRYTLDAAGNRTAVSALEPAELAPLAANSDSYDAANHPANRSDGQSYRYDARGNLTAIQGSRTAFFSYDAFGRLQSVNADADTGYAYDSAGLRVARTGNGADRNFVYDLSGARPRVVAEADSSNAPVAWYVHGLGLLWKVTADGKTYFYHFDGDGNVVAVSNPAAGVVNQYRYDPLGRLVTSNETVENTFRARGESGWIDDRNGLVFTGSAYEFPELKVTLPASVDPSAPAPDLLPRASGAVACFVEGVSSCIFASGRRQR